MRRRALMSVYVAAASVSLLLVFCESSRTKEPRQAPAGIKELKERRLAILLDLCEGVKRLFEKGRAEYSEVHAAEREIFAARLAYSDTQQERIKACDLAIEDTHYLRGVIEARKDGAGGSRNELAKIQEFELQAQIERAKITAE